MTETSEILPAIVDAPARQEASESLASQVKAHPGLVVAGGLALGVLASALLPRGTGRRLAQGAIAAAAVGGEAGMALARQARDSARTAAGEATEHLQTLEDKAGEGARQLRRRAVVATGSAASAGLDLTRAALRLLASLKR